jgi:hypothetical protein
MSLLRHITYLIRASALAEAEDQQLRRKHGIDNTLYDNPFDPQVVKWTFEDRPEESKIKGYLNELDHGTLLKIETLIYFGRRDDSENLRDLKSLSSYLADLNNSKDEIVETIVDKRGAYPVYFQKALTKLKKQGIDVESI